MDYQSIIGDGSVNRNFGEDIDRLISVLQGAQRDIVLAQSALLTAGVKSVKDGQMNYMPGLNVERFFACGNQEFYWEAEYLDGTVIRQYEGKVQKNFAHIDQSKLKLVRWVSNFDGETDSAERRVIVSLDFIAGTFEFTNGFVPQEVRGELLKVAGVGPDAPKLILKMVKRMSTSLTFPSGGVDTLFHYRRYLIGFEGAGRKVVLCVEPNGFTHLWHGEVAA